MTPADPDAGNVLVLPAPWNKAWFSALEGFEKPLTTMMQTAQAAFNALIDASTYTLANILAQPDRSHIVFVILFWIAQPKKQLGSSHDARSVFPYLSFARIKSQ